MIGICQMAKDGEGFAGRANSRRKITDVRKGRTRLESHGKLGSGAWGVLATLGLGQHA